MIQVKIMQIVNSKPAREAAEQELAELLNAGWKIVAAAGDTVGQYVYLERKIAEDEAHVTD